MPVTAEAWGHYDNYDVFCLQAAGVRRWEVGGLFGEDSPGAKIHR